MTRFALLAVVACAACHRSAQTAGTAARPVAPPVSHSYDANEVGAAIAQVWELDIAGKHEQARPILARVVATLGAARRERGTGDTQLGALIAEGTFVVVTSPAGVALICDVATGKVVGSVPHGATVEPIKGTPLFTTTEAGKDRGALNLVIREAPTGSVLQRFDDIANHAVADDGRVVVVSDSDAIVAYDTQQRTITQRIPHPPGSHPADLIVGDRGNAVTAVMADDSADPGYDMQITYDLQTGKELVRGPAYNDMGPPAFSPDGTTIALSGARRGEDRPDDIRLVDRATTKTIATSRACDFPTSFAFSANGKQLAVGQLRRACIFDVNGLRLVARTPDLRPGFPGDDLQDTDVRFIGKVLVATTADGTVGLFTVPGAKKLLVDRGELIQIRGTPHVAIEETNQLIAIDASGSISRRARTADEAGRPPFELDDDHASPDDAVFKRIDPNVCRIHDWLLPRAACD